MAGGCARPIHGGPVTSGLGPVWPSERDACRLRARYAVAHLGIESLRPEWSSGASARSIELIGVRYSLRANRRWRSRIDGQSLEPSRDARTLRMGVVSDGAGSVC